MRGRKWSFWIDSISPPVMRGLDPRIHVFLAKKQGVDGRDKPGHDERRRQPNRENALGTTVLLRGAGGHRVLRASGKPPAFRLRKHRLEIEQLERVAAEDVALG